MYSAIPKLSLSSISVTAVWLRHRIRVPRLVRCPFRLLLPALLAAWTAGAGIITDGFEGGIGPIWVNTEVVQSSSYVHSGSYSAFFQNSYLAQLLHYYGSAQEGSVSVFIQRPACCLGNYAALGISNGDGVNYGSVLAELDFSDNPIGFGTMTGRVFGNGGEDDGRTIAPNPFDWHEVGIVASRDGVDFMLDGQTFYSHAGDFRFNTVYMQQWLAGASARAAFDDFSSNTNSSGGPEPRTFL